jgi:hypothetical protein
MLFTEGAPTIVCMHSSCEAAVAEKNLELRRAFPSASANRVKASQDWRRTAEVRQVRKEALALQGARAMERIIREHAWSQVDIWEASPVRFSGAPNWAETQYFLASAFAPDDLVWIGRNERSNESGSIRQCAAWLEDDSLLARPSICPSVMSNVGGGRRNENVATTRYFIFEADGLSADPEDNIERSGALLRWLREVVGLKLFAVVFSGNRSLHGWVVADDRLKEFIASPDSSSLIGALGFDISAKRAAQAFRLPGHIREETGRVQTLLYLDPVAGANGHGIGRQMLSTNGGSQ